MLVWLAEMPRLVVTASLTSDHDIFGFLLPRALLPLRPEPEPELPAAAASAGFALSAACA